MPISAGTYFAEAASMDLFEVRSSELVLARARNARTRQFASAMSKAHKGTAAQLSFAGRRLNLLPKPQLRPREQAMLETLSRTRDFDKLYRQQQIALHQAELRLHNAYAVRGGSPTLRAVAANAVLVVREHIGMLRRL